MLTLASSPISITHNTLSFRRVDIPRCLLKSLTPSTISLSSLFVIAAVTLQSLIFSSNPWKFLSTCSPMAPCSFFVCLRFSKSVCTKQLEEDVPTVSFPRVSTRLDLRRWLPWTCLSKKIYDIPLKKYSIFIVTQYRDNVSLAEPDSGD